MVFKFKFKLFICSFTSVKELVLQQDLTQKPCLAWNFDVEQAGFEPEAILSLPTQILG